MSLVKIILTNYKILISIIFILVNRIIVKSLKPIREYFPKYLKFNNLGSTYLNYVLNYDLNVTKDFQKKLVEN